MAKIKNYAEPIQIARKIFGIFWIIVFCIVMQQLLYWNIIPGKAHTADDFGIETIKSSIDYNNNGIDDYSDFVAGAREYIETKPEYKSEYYDGGYPPEGIGVCTDVIWHAFKEAGYDLKTMVDDDIASSLASYPEIETPDPNIDFRRVVNLKVFFMRNAESLTLDPEEISEWQPGDIVTYNNHIAIVSDKRNRKGIAFIIHHGGLPKYEEDALDRRVITGHYRWKSDN